MNFISFAVWTLEKNCFVVYTVLIVFFVGFTMFHKQKMEAQYRRDGKKKLLRTGHSRKVGAGLAGSKQPSQSRLRHKAALDHVYGSMFHLFLTHLRMLQINTHKITIGLHLENEFPDEDDDPDLLLPAIAEDTPQIPYQPPKMEDYEILQRSREYYELMAKRRTVRSFSQDPIPQEVLDNIIKTAGTAPSGAHTEPWTFVVVQDKETKEAIRYIVEEEEELNYSKRMSRQWVTDLKPFATKPVKPYLTDAPVLLLVFRQTHSWRPDGKKRMHYYSEISTAIAAGILLAAIQYCGLAALTSTPLNCNARLRDLLSRPVTERLELLLPVGRPHMDCTVPDLQRKTLDEIMVKA